MDDQAASELGACADWQGARARLSFLKTTLYGNFADLEGDVSKIKKQRVQRGFVVDVEPYEFGDATMLRLSDQRETTKSIF